MTETITYECRKCEQETPCRLTLTDMAVAPSLCPLESGCDADDVKADWKRQERADD